ncbi:GNAT family N-acetyltransferase [Streptomyces sp. NPDC018833]|uniref:GNAT family N-acetyltransferase n=1 Tax=Streptomyces sp. NPDC018833 TaxID=3365053 RepID=UPI0037909375
MSEATSGECARDVSVEAAAEQDVAEILTVLKGAFAPFSAEFRPTALRQTAESVGRELSRWLIARHNGRIHGCVMQYPEGSHYTLCFLAVSPDHRKLGLGSALVEAVIERAGAAGCREIHIALRRSLAQNIAFFERRGFRFLAPFNPHTHDLYRLTLGA